MKFMQWSKDGGPESTVSGLFFVEIKGLFSIVLLRFGDGSRDAYHSHAFNCLSWVLKGKLHEYHKDGRENPLPRTLLPFWTYRNTFHKVVSEGVSWVFTLRGPWAKTWVEHILVSGEGLVLADGRVNVTPSMCLPSCVVQMVRVPPQEYEKPMGTHHAPNCPNGL